jgi:hypothetical protein
MQPRCHSSSSWARSARHTSPDAAIPTLCPGRPTARTGKLEATMEAPTAIAMVPGRRRGGPAPKRRRREPAAAADQREQQSRRRCEVERQARRAADHPALPARTVAARAAARFGRHRKRTGGAAGRPWTGRHRRKTAQMPRRLIISDFEGNGHCRRAGRSQRKLVFLADTAARHRRRAGPRGHSRRRTTTNNSQ